MNVPHDHPYVIVGRKKEFRQLRERAGHQVIQIDTGSRFFPVASLPGATGSVQQQVLGEVRPVGRPPLVRQQAVRNVRPLAGQSGLFFTVAKLEKEMKEEVKSAAFGLVGMMASVADAGTSAGDAGVGGTAVLGDFLGKTEYQLTLFLRPAGLRDQVGHHTLIEVHSPITLEDLLGTALEHWPRALAHG